MFGKGGLFMKYNVYDPEDRNEKWRVATHTSYSIFDSYDMKCFWFIFGHYIWIQIGKSLKLGRPFFKLFHEMKLKTS